MNKFNDYNTKVFGFHMKNDQLTIVQGAMEAINIKPTTLGAVKIRSKQHSLSKDWG